MTTAIAWKVKDRAYYQDQACTIEQFGTAGKYKGKVKVITSDDFEGTWVDARLLTRSKNGRSEPKCLNLGTQAVGKPQKIPTPQPDPTEQFAKEVNERELHHWYKKAMELQRQVAQLEQERDYWRQQAESPSQPKPQRKASGSLSEPATGTPVYSYSVKVDGAWKTKSKRVPVELIESVKRAIADNEGVESILSILNGDHQATVS